MGKSKHEKRHPSCALHGPGIRIERYDAYACIECNKWLESDCDDPACAFCAMRPERPIERHMDEVVHRIAAAYPTVFDMSSGCWDDCPPGWETTVTELCARLAVEHPTVRCAQCKQKWGALRFYVNEEASEAARALICEYEQKCSETCALCGKVTGARLCAEHETKPEP